MVELTESAAIRRLHDRLGFGLGGSRLAAAQQQGFDGAAARVLLQVAPSDAGAAPTPPNMAYRPRPGKVGRRPPMDELRAWRREMKQQIARLTLWWLDRMVVTDQAATERLTWFWHGHFATSALAQVEQVLRRVRQLGPGRLAGGSRAASTGPSRA